MVDCPVNAGKNRQFRRTLELLATRNNGDCGRWLIIVYRKTLNANLIGDLEPFGFKAYNDNRVDLKQVNPENTPRLIIVVNNMKNLETWYNGIAPYEGPSWNVLLDEGGETCYQMASPALLDSLDMTLVEQTVAKAVAQAPYLIIMQYRLREGEANFFLSMRNPPLQIKDLQSQGGTINTIVSNDTYWQGKKVVIFKHQATAMDALIYMWLGGINLTPPYDHKFPIVVPCTYNKMAKAIYNTLMHVTQWVLLCS